MKVADILGESVTKKKLTIGVIINTVKSSSMSEHDVEKVLDAVEGMPRTKVLSREDLDQLVAISGVKELYDQVEHLCESKKEVANEQPLELKDVVANFPKTYKKIIKEMWGKPNRLTYKGQPLFAEGDLGPAYLGVMDAVEKILKRGLEVTVEFRGEFDDVDLTDLDGQECYLGYDPKADKLYSGYDIWARGDEIEGIFDKLFKEATGEDFDPDSNDKKFTGAWKEFREKNMGNLGGLFEMSTSDGKKFTAETLETKNGGFYSGIYNSRKKSGSGEFKNLQLIDLRLD